MTRTSRCLVPTTLAALALSASVAMAAGPQIPLPEMVVSKTLTPPKIDGKIDPGEWDRAPAATGFVRAFQGDLIPIQSVVRITYDDTYLYVTLRNERGAKLKLLQKKGRRLDDEGIVFDPSNEIWFSPPVTPAVTYQTLFNAYPDIYDTKMIPSLGYSAKAWTGHWEIAATESKDDWIVEARAPIKSFGMPKITDGSTWRGLFTADVFADGFGFRAWAPGGGFADIPRHGFLHFKDNAPVFQLLSIGSIFTGKVNFPMAVTGATTGSSAITVTARFGAAIAAAPEDTVVTKTVTVAAGKHEEFALAADLTKLELPEQGAAGNKNPGGYCSILAKTADGTVLYTQTFPFVINGFVQQGPETIDSTPYKTAFGLEAFYAPLSKKLVVKIDRYYMPERLTTVSGKIRLTEAKTGQLVAERAIAQFRQDISEFPVDLTTLQVPLETEEDFVKNKPVQDENNKIRAENKKLAAQNQPELPLKELPGTKPAAYQLEAVLTRADGSEVAKTIIPVELMGYQFEWLGNTIGMSDKVIPPWTPIQQEGPNISMWNKTYQLNALGLAEKITNANAPQLAAPMKLVAVIDGKETEIPGGKPTVTKTTDAGLDLTGSTAGAGLQVQTKTRVEFDGFVLNTMTVQPTATKVDRLSLVITMPEAEAPCLVTTCGGWSAYHGWTPDKWDSRETALGNMVGNFVPYIFLTDSDRGFCWFGDSEKGWLLDPSAPTQELSKANGQVILRVNFITKPGPITAPMTVTYGWMVTPQKPQPKGWRATIFGQSKPCPEFTALFWADADRYKVWDYYSSPFPLNYDKSKAEIDRSIPGFVPCVGNIAHSIGRYLDYKGRWFVPVAADWGNSPGVTNDGNVATSRGTTDFEIWHFDRWAKVANLTGLYYDENYLSEDWNYLTGGAYLLPDERVQPGYTYLGLREYDKRLRYMFHDNGKPTPNIWLHTTGGQPVYAWMPDVSMEAENVEPASLENDYIECLPAGRIRAIGMGRNLGCASTVMCQSQRHRIEGGWEFLTHQFVGWLLLHDTLPEQVELWQNALASEMQIWREDIRFVPYWKDGQGIASSNKDVVVSGHVRPGQAILWIMNLAREDRSTQVRLDLAKLGLEPGKPILAFDAETGDPVPLQGSTFDINVPKRLWRAVRLMQPQLLQGKQTFVAHFDQASTADEALGMIYPRRDRQAPQLVAGKFGQALSLDTVASYETRLHLTRESGEITCQLQVGAATKAGDILTIGDMKLQYNQGALSLAQKSAPAVPASAKLTPATWHAVKVAWTGQTVKVSVDGAEVLTATLAQPLPIQVGARGMQINNGALHITPPAVSFGPLKGAALDDLTMGL